MLIDDPDRPSLLADRPLTDDERVVRDESPRPGTLHGDSARDVVRWMFTQDETDALIRVELLSCVRPSERDVLIRIVSVPRAMMIYLMRRDGRQIVATCQRGGIDTDPLVRVLAFRAWGDRDRWWFWYGKKHRCPIL
jgi:hypothetical protein